MLQLTPQSTQPHSNRAEPSEQNDVEGWHTKAKTDLVSFFKIQSTLHLMALRPQIGSTLLCSLNDDVEKHPQEEDLVLFNKSGPFFLIASRPLLLLNHGLLVPVLNIVAKFGVQNCAGPEERLEWEIRLQVIQKTLFMVL